MQQDYLNKEVNLNDPGLAQVFDETSLWGAHFGRLLLENVPLKSNLNVLDIGCGNGFPLFELAHQLGPSSKLTGIDIWKSALERANFKKNYYGLKNVTIIHADASKMPFENDQFDLITSNLGINNFKDPQQSLSEAFRVLKPEGEIIITTNTVGHMQLFYTVYQQVLKDLGRFEIIPELKKQEAHRKTVEEITEMFRIAGFQIIKIISENLTLRYLDGSAFLRHSLTIYGFLDGWRSILAGEEEEIIFKTIEEKLNEIADKDGELRFNVPMFLIHARKNKN